MIHEKKTSGNRKTNYSTGKKGAQSKLCTIFFHMHPWWYISRAKDNMVQIKNERIYVERKMGFYFNCKMFQQTVEMATQAISCRLEYKHAVNGIYLEIKRYFRTNHKTKINYGAVLNRARGRERQRNRLQCSGRSSCIHLSLILCVVQFSVSFAQCVCATICWNVLLVYWRFICVVFVVTFCCVHLPFGYMVFFCTYTHSLTEIGLLRIALKHDVHTPSIR